MTIEELAAAPLILYDARWGAVDPMRRQLAERAQRAGVRIEPQIEVEYIDAALDLAARGLGDTIAAPSVLVTRGFSRRLHSVSLDPPLYDTFAFVTRRNAHLSPATRAFLELAERRLDGHGQRVLAGYDGGHVRTTTRPSPKRSTCRRSSGSRRRGCR